MNFDSGLILLIAKAATNLASPLGLSLFLISVSYLVPAFTKVKRTSLLSGGLVLWLCSTPIFSDWMMRTLEQEYLPTSIESLPASDVAIVLGGAVSDAIPPRVTSELSDAADRVLFASRLYKASKVQRILVTGGNLPWLGKGKPEAEVIRELLKEWGVPSSAIEIAGASRNTFENAIEIAALAKQQPFKSALLITSAFHMPRAFPVFKKAGIPVIPASTDVRIVEGKPFTLLDIIPNADALQMTTTAFKEWLGYFVYWARGYI